MSQIIQLLQLHQQSDSIKSIARKTGLSRNTVKAYLNKLKGLKMDIPALLVSKCSVIQNTPLYPRNKSYSNHYQNIR